MADIPSIICVGLGPGRADLLTLEAASVLAQARRVAYFHKAGETGRGLNIAQPHLHPSAQHIALTYPLTTEAPTHSHIYREQMTQFYDAACEQLAAIVAQPLPICTEKEGSHPHLIVLCEGDPMLYGSFLHLHRRLRERHPHIPVRILAGLPAMSGCWHAAQQPMTLDREALTLIPATLDLDRMTALAAAADALAFIKVGRNLPRVIQALEKVGKISNALLIENAQTPQQRVRPVAELADALHAGAAPQAPYFSMVLVPGPAAHTMKGFNQATAAQPTPKPTNEVSGVCAPAALDRSEPCHPGSLRIVGLGPGAAQWASPAAVHALRHASDVLGYGLYVQRARALLEQQNNFQSNHLESIHWHASDNREELDRARSALALAAQGRHTVLVSSGDAGVFGMAAAVFEAIESAAPATRQHWAALDIAVVPGITAALAAAARVGAPLGHDFCCINLSDNLKPATTVQQRLALALEADFAIALYNPRSHARPAALGQALDLVRAHDPARLIVFAHAVGSTHERIEHCCARDARADTADMRTLVLIGSSATRALPRPDGSAWIYTPRRADMPAPQPTA